MTHLLDTQAWLWAMEDPGRLPDAVQRVLSDAAHLPLGLSSISPWEVSKKESIGKLVLSVPVRHWLEAAVREPFIELLNLSVEVSHECNHLPGEFHRDPADQIIVATARLHNLTLITADHRIRAYPHVRCLWA